MAVWSQREYSCVPRHFVFRCVLTFSPEGSTRKIVSKGFNPRPTDLLIYLVQPFGYVAYSHTAPSDQCSLEYDMHYHDYISLRSPRPCGPPPPSLPMYSPRDGHGASVSSGKAHRGTEGERHGVYCTQGGVEEAVILAV